ncbi:hypothetical protein EJV47_19370 [Hymenobacter gummosus]|uniref:Uncharacterized protein n=1 Tax=Hymenobacter gummosus TaxID=1776032 RepID=A0A3S0ILH8_9BACT|nr:hypothetical protein [Hymenobacter gummosus]RTQ47577.1 hypothetical protein EJV47_19370 [Hymenobacter gummosus]
MSGITSTTTYTLTVTIGSFTHTTSVTASYCPCDHTYAQNSSATYNPQLNQPANANSYEIGTPFVTTEIDASLYGGTVVFSGQYHVLGPLRLSNGTFELTAGTTFFIEPNNAQVKSAICQDYYFNGFSDRKTWIEVNKSSLILNGATLTSTCETVWGGVLAGAESKIYTYRIKAGTRVYRSIIRDASVGIFADASCVPGSNGPQLYLTNTNFTNNWYGVMVGNKATPKVGEGIVGCIFSSDPPSMLAPVQPSGNNLWYTETGMLLSNGDYTDFQITGNTFQSLRVGAEVEGKKIAISSNTFERNYAAAIRTGLKLGTTSIDIASNTIQVPSLGITTAQLDANNPVTGIELLGSDCQAINVLGNTIDGVNTNPALVAKRQIGIDVRTRCQVSIKQLNTVRRLDAGIHLMDDSNQGVAPLLIADNKLRDNQVSLYFAHDNSYFTLEPVIECNQLDHTNLPAAQDSKGLFLEQMITPTNETVLGSDTRPCGNIFSNVPTQALNESFVNALKYFRFASTQEQITISGPSSQNTVTTAPFAPGTNSDPANACTTRRGYSVGVVAPRNVLPTATTVVGWMNRLRQRQGTPTQLWELEQLLMRHHESTGQLVAFQNFVGTLPLLNHAAFERLSFYLMDQFRRRQQETAAQAVRQQLLVYSANDRNVANRVRYFDVLGRLAYLPLGGKPTPADSALLAAAAQTNAAYSNNACTVMRRFYPHLRCTADSVPTRPAVPPTVSKAVIDYLQVPHPNPANDVVEFRYTTPDYVPALLSIRDVKTGKEVLSKQLIGAKEGVITIPVTTLPAGFYACTLVISGRPVGTQKLVLVH